jgi:hypothetical protein
LQGALCCFGPACVVAFRALGRPLCLARVVASRLFRASRCARFVATWRLSPAVRSSFAGHKLRGIAGHSKQRYRVGKGWRSVLSSNISFKADGYAAA